MGYTDRYPGAGASPYPCPICALQRADREVAQPAAGTAPPVSWDWHRIRLWGPEAVPSTPLVNMTWRHTLPYLQGTLAGNQPLSLTYLDDLRCLRPRPWYRWRCPLALGR